MGCARLAGFGTKSAPSWQQSGPRLQEIVDDFGARSDVVGSAVAKLADSHGQDLGWFVPVSCRVDHEKTDLGLVQLFRKRRHWNYTASCFEDDTDLSKLDSSCQLFTTTTGYCGLDCSAQLPCAGRRPSREFQEAVDRGATLVLSKRSLGYKVTNPGHLCSPPSTKLGLQEVSNRSTALLIDFKFYAQHAAAAYCNSQRSPRETVQCSTHCPSLEANGAEVVYAFSAPSTDVNGYVAVDTERREIVLSFRGSTSWSNWFTNLKFGFELCDFVSGCQVHAGYASAWEEVSGDIERVISHTRLQNDGYRVVVAGHSLGGAMATLAAAHLRRAGIDLDAYAYGAPRVGNQQFTNFASLQPNGKLYRITHRADIVPLVPPRASGYEHTYPEYWIDAAASETNPAEVNISVCTGIVNTGCSFGTLISDVAAHLSYFGKTDGCLAQGTQSRPAEELVLGAETVQAIRND